MKDWLTLIILVVIIGIVLDGIRRMRAARRENIRLSRNAKKADAIGETSASRSEFPSGGARVAARRDEKDISSLNETVRKKFESKKVTLGAPNRIPEQVSLNLDEAVPMLMDSVEEAEANDSSASEYEEEYTNQHEPDLGDYSSLDDENASEEQERVGVTTEEDDIDEQAAAEPSARTSETKEDAEPKYEEPDEVLIFNVMAKSGRRFAGTDLLNALMQENMKFGNMDIFHRHQDNDGDGPVLYSLANMVVPGTFNLAEMENFSTPGVTMFLSLPVEGDSLAVYNDLAATAKKLADTLGGELKDENRSVMTGQTVEHGRQRVIEYERKRKLAHA